MSAGRLFVRLPNWLGDIVMALPAVIAVRRAWPDAHLAVGLPRAFAPIMSLVPGIDAVVELEAGHWRDRTAVARDVSTVREGRFGRGLLFTNSYASARMLRDAGVPERWGYASDLRSSLLTRPIAKPRGRRGRDRHQARYYGHLVEACGAPRPDDDLRLTVPDEWRARAMRLLVDRGVPRGATLVGFAPGAAYGTAKQWPPDRVAAVMRRAVRDDGLAAVMVGAGRDAAAGTAIHQALAATGDAGVVVDLIGATDLATLVGVISHCRTFVCNDSGAMHLATIVGVQVVAAFGPTDETATAPLGPHRLIVGTAWCRPCMRRECPIDHRCMTSITPDDVYVAVAGLNRDARC